MGFFDDRDDLGPPPDPFRLQDRGSGGSRFRTPIALRWLGLAAAILVALVAANVLKSLYVDLLWFDSVGPSADDSYSGIFRTVVVSRVLLFLGGAAITAAVVGANIWIALRLAPRAPEESFIEEVDAQAIRSVVMVLLVAATLFLAVVFGSVAGGSWETLLRWMNGVEFGVDDPQFNRDISFYLFKLPAYHFVQGWLLALLVVSTLAAGTVYGLAFSLQRFVLNITPGMRIHLSVLVGLILLVIALGTFLSVFDLANSAGGIVYGATYTDVNARLPVRYLLIGLALFAGIATIANAFITRGYRLPLFAFGLWAAAGLVGGAIYPQAIQSFTVEPNELEREERFIARNIAQTRLAWGLDRIEESTFPALPSVTAAELEANEATLQNIRVLDPRPLLDTLNQIQSIRPFYQFTDVDVDRYVLDGKARQVMLSARELNVSRADDRNWTRERLQLTHGFGAVVTPVNEVAPESGLPTLLTADIPPVSAIEELELSVEGSRIYFGALTNHYVIVNTNVAEFDYPLGEGQNAETRYEPDRGIRLSSFVERMALAWELGDTNLLISGQIGSGSRLLMHRNLQERIEKIAPFLLLDPDPYLVVEDSRLFWIQDAYTTSGNFPYSEPRGEVNYIRNSVKVLVDAVTGDTTFYLIDEADPVARTWEKIFPDLFQPGSDMPDFMREHLRYPELLFRLQADLYLKYHVGDPAVFFVGEDFWNIPTERFRQQEQQVDPYYVIMKLPGEEEEEFALILPFTPRNKLNTVAWLAARSDGEHYGTLKAYRFPTDDLVFGPAQIEARIDQNTGISQQLTLWDQSGSEVIRGNLLMIPIGDSFLFVEPIYLQASTSRLPELKRIVVANGSAIAMEETFQKSLDVVLGRRASTLPGTGAFPTVPSTPTTPSTPSQPLPSDLTGLLQQAQEAFDASEADLERLREILEALSQLQ
ncbi:MAG: UPF0182 family protein [Chloroflexi bacterium]|nr:UPF0182 family protein [Chloroflexota bacterium]